MQKVNCSYIFGGAEAVLGIEEEVENLSDPDDCNNSTSFPEPKQKDLND